MKKQKFKRGNLVHVAKDLGQSMSHFRNDTDAIIIGSYADLFGGDGYDRYTIMFLDNGEQCAWYWEDQLTLIDEGGKHLFDIAAENKKNFPKRDCNITDEVAALLMYHLFP